MQWNTTQQKKKQIIDICDNISESQNHDERKKSNTKYNSPYLKF